MKLQDIIEYNQYLELQEIQDIDLIKDIQFNLNRGGYSLDIDGTIGPKTLKAFARFKKDFYLEHPTQIGKATAKILLQLPSIEHKYVKPTDGIGWLSSPFGKRARGYHKGVDIAANEGTAIYAIADGKVTIAVSGCSVGNYLCGGGYGNVVYLQHSGLPFDESRYAHLSRLAAGIASGTLISKGMPLGYVGNTGHSFGCHLHFELRKNGQAFNPLSVICPIV